jgi:hypothetical protein
MASTKLITSNLSDDIMFFVRVIADLDEAFR